MSRAMVTGGGKAQMRELAARLRAADPELRRNLRRQFRAIGDPIVRDVRASIMDMPSKTREGHLRADIARTVASTTSVTRSGVKLSIVSYGRRMPAGRGEDVLPKHVDSARGWGHPVYARGPRSRWRWVHQEGKPQWFETPVESHQRYGRQAAQAALDDTAKMLQR